MHFLNKFRLVTLSLMIGMIFGLSPVQAKVGLFFGTGYQATQFGDPTVSDLVDLQGMTQGFGLYYLRLSSQWLFQCEQNQIFPTTISPFVLADGQAGDFQLGLTQQLFGLGKRFSNHTVLLKFGQETVSWTGTIEMSPKSTKASLVGIEYSYSGMRRGRWLMPLWFQYLNHSSKVLEFEQFPDDHVRLSAGASYSGGLSFGVEF